MQPDRYTLIAVPSSKVREEWPSVRDHICSALVYTPQHTEETTIEALADGWMTLWKLFDGQSHIASGTTCIDEYPATKELIVLHLGGSGMEEWGKFATDRMVEVAHLNGCSSVVSIGRKGTERLYKSFGYEFGSVLMRRPVNG